MMNRKHSYEIGDIALSCDIDTSHSADAEAKRVASSFQLGDGAFVRRSDRIWRYAMVSEVSYGSDPFIIFIVAADGSTKKFGQRHWGDRVRPLKLPLVVRRARKISSQDNGMRSSCDTQIMACRSDSQSSEDRSAGRIAVNSVRGNINDKAINDRTEDTDDGPHVEEMYEIIPRHQANDRPKLKRRGSLKDMASTFIRRFSRGELEHQAPLSHKDRAFDSAKATDDMRNHEFKEIAQEDDGSLIASNESDKTNQNRRRANSRQKRGSFTLTTSLLFKNLMKETNILGDSEDPPKRYRRETLPVNFLKNEEQDNTITQISNGVPKNVKPRRPRRATVQSGRSSTSVYKTDAQAAKGISNNSSPSASFTMKNAFAHLVEEKKCLHPSTQRS